MVSRRIGRKISGFLTSRVLRICALLIFDVVVVIVVVVAAADVVDVVTCRHHFLLFL